MQQSERRGNFGTAARRRQGNFHDTSPTVSLRGRSPDDDKGMRNRHLLALGYEEENLYQGIRGSGGAIDFFSARGMGWWKSSRSGDDARSSGPTRNMASSQVACVNFLLPLADIPGALTEVLRAIDHDVTDVVEIQNEGSVSPLEFEWLGMGGSLEGAGSRGANATSIDAFLIADTSRGRRAYLLEWKYVEEYLTTKPENKGAGRSGDTRRARYRDRYRSETSSFNLAVAPEMEDFFYEPFYQIMRQRLLADRMVQQQELGVTEAKVVVVVPEENLGYRRVTEGRRTTSPPLVHRFTGLETVREVVVACLKDPDSQFNMVAPRALADAVEQACSDNAAVTDWLTYWRERYDV